MNDKSCTPPARQRASSDAQVRGLDNRGGTPGRLTPTADLGAAVIALLLLNGCASMMVRERWDEEREQRAAIDATCRTECPSTPDAPKCRANCPGLYEAVQRAKGECAK